MKVLIVRLSSLGDVIHTFPALTDLAAARPETELDWLVEEGFASFAGLHPAVDSVVGLAERRLRWPPNRWPAYVSSRRWLRGQLETRRYDLVVDLQGLMKSALVARMPGSPVAGYDAKSIREPTASPFYDRKYAVSRDLHAVERNRRLLAAAIGYDVPATPADFGLAVAGRKEVPALPERFCALVHSASWPSKLWPEENWRRLVGHLATRGLSVVLPWGSNEEKARAERIAAGNKDAIVLPDRLDGADLAAAIGGARCAIGLDSGLMHLAAALAVPGVWLFGPTDPGLTGPCSANQSVVQSTGENAPCRTRDCAHGPAGRTCMDMVDFDRVAAAIDELLESTTP